MDIERFVWTEHAEARRHRDASDVEPGATLAEAMFAYYDSDADIAWFPTGDSDDVVSERVPGGLRDYDRASHKLQLGDDRYGVVHAP